MLLMIGGAAEVVVLMAVAVVLVFNSYSFGDSDTQLPTMQRREPFLPTTTTSLLLVYGAEPIRWWWVYRTTTPMKVSGCPSLMKRWKPSERMPWSHCPKVSSSSGSSSSSSSSS